MSNCLYVLYSTNSKSILFSEIIALYTIIQKDACDFDLGAIRIKY